MLHEDVMKSEIYGGVFSRQEKQGYFLSRAFGFEGWCCVIGGLDENDEMGRNTIGVFGDRDRACN